MSTADNVEKVIMEIIDLYHEFHSSEVNVTYAGYTVSIKRNIRDILIGIHSYSRKPLFISRYNELDESLNTSIYGADNKLYNIRSYNIRSKDRFYSELETLMRFIYSKMEEQLITYDIHPELVELIDSVSKY